MEKEFCPHSRPRKAISALRLSSYFPSFSIGAAGAHKVVEIKTYDVFIPSQLRSKKKMQVLLGNSLIVIIAAPSLLYLNRPV